MPEPLISNVSDTARWIAAYRARETLRPDALFRDTLAEKLAGPRGRAMADRAPWFMRGGGMIVARTKLIDDIVAQAVAAGADTVVNLAAGLDTRPYRLALPSSLNWIEADLPGIVDEKEELLRGETPVCRLRREKVDVCDRAAFPAFLDRTTAGARWVLAISEGLVTYLEAEQVATLAADLFARPAVRWWVVNFNSPRGMRMVGSNFRRTLGNVAMKFAPANGVAFFEKLGWRTAEVHNIIREASRLKRGPLWLRLLAKTWPDSDPRAPKRGWGALVRFERP
jgi:methyltransferase (TIGR00027 family)